MIGVIVLLILQCECSKLLEIYLLYYSDAFQIGQPTLSSLSLGLYALFNSLSNFRSSYYHERSIDSARFSGGGGGYQAGPSLPELYWFPYGLNKKYSANSIGLEIQPSIAEIDAQRWILYCWQCIAYSVKVSILEENQHRSDLIGNLCCINNVSRFLRRFSHLDWFRISTDSTRCRTYLYRRFQH